MRLTKPLVAKGTCFPELKHTFWPSSKMISASSEHSYGMFVNCWFLQSKVPMSAVLYYTSQYFICWDFVGMTIQEIQLSHRELSLSRRESCNSRLIYDEKQVNLESSRITFLRISREIHVSRHSSPKFEKCNSRIKPPFSHSRLI